MTKSCPLRRVRTLKLRLEPLEQRCLLAYAPIGSEISIVDEAFVDQDRWQVVVGRGELELPKMPVPETPPWEANPPSAENPDDDGGGMIELGEFGNPAGGAPADTSPPNVLTLRESRAVLEMLATLKYVPGQSDAAASAADPLAGSEDKGQTASDNRDPDMQLRDLQAEGGPVAIAMGELAAELTIEQQAAPSSKSLLDVDVEMDNAAGRYQAFEVFSGDEAFPAHMPSTGQHPIGAQVTVDSSFQRNTVFVVTYPASAAIAAQNGSEESSPPVPEIEARAGQLACAAPVEETNHTAGVSAVSLIATGLLFQAWYSGRLKQLKTRAGKLWQRLPR